MADEANAADPPRTVAGLRTARWPGWIWAIPLAVIGIVVWLVVRDISQRGTSITVSFTDAAQMKADTTRVMYRGIEMGKVTHVALSKDGALAVATLSINRAATRYLTTGTRFYLEGAKPSLGNLASLKAVIAGPTIEMLPGPGPASRSFVGLEGKAPEALAVAVPYSVQLDGPAGQLKAGDPVTLRGFTVGEVTAVELHVDPDKGSIDTRVGLALDPLRFHLQRGSRDDWDQVMNATLTALVRHNLRARLTQSPPLVGSREVELAVVADAAPAQLEMAAGVLQIPAVAGGGIGDVVASAAKIPLAEIGDNVRAITRQLRTLTASPQLKDSITHLDGALGELDKTLQQAGPEVAPTLRATRQTVDSLKRTAGELDATVKAARMTIGADPAAPDGSLEPALLHVSEAARSIRVLADYLDQHPEALIRGR